MPKPLVSIVIPLYNQGNYLQETVESALASSYRPIEVIIVNDGSTDNSLDVALSLEKEFPEVIVIDQTNHGLTKARNRGIRESKGEIILPLDSDDLISSNYVEEAVKVLTEQPEVKVVYSEAVKFNEKIEKKWKLKPFSRYQLARDNMIYASAFFRKSEALEVGGFSEDINLGREDWEFWIKMLKNGGDVVRLPFVGFYYRLTPTSRRKKTATRSKKRARIDFFNQKHADFFEKELDGPLRYQRTYSKYYNKFLKFFGLLSTRKD